MLEARYESPLAHRSASTDTSVTIREISERGMIDLRGPPTDKKFMAAAKSVLGVDLPKQPRTSAAWGDIKVLWLSPDQWLVTCARAKALELADDLSKALAGIHSLAVNVSDMRAIIRLEGEGCREVLLTGPGLARNQFRDWCQAHSTAVAGCIVDSIAADHPTDAQLVAMARQYFKKFDAMASDPSLA